MKKIIALMSISAFFLIFILPAFSETASDKKIIELFEKKVVLFEKFFAGRPKFLEKQSFSKSPSQYIFFWNKFDNAAVSYDIRKTDSLISPYIADITINYLEVVSKSCGDFKSDYGEEKWHSTIDGARSSRDNDSCYTASLKRGIKFLFACQKGKWVFKNALNTYNNETEPRIATLLGNPINGRYPVEDNKSWLALIED